MDNLIDPLPSLSILQYRAYHVPVLRLAGSLPLLPAYRCALLTSTGRRLQPHATIVTYITPIPLLPSPTFLPVCLGFWFTVSRAELLRCLPRGYNAPQPPTHAEHFDERGYPTHAAAAFDAVDPVVLLPTTSGIHIFQLHRTYSTRVPRATRRHTYAYRDTVPAFNIPHILSLFRTLYAPTSRDGTLSQ